MVSSTAIGSLVPDSISNVAVTRWFSRTALVCSSENTAAASVEPTMAPISRPCARLKERIQAEKPPTTPVVTSTPTVASDSEGRSATRKLSSGVRRPPSNKITARPQVPARLAKW